MEDSRTFQVCTKCHVPGKYISNHNALLCSLVNSSQYNSITREPIYTMHTMGRKQGGYKGLMRALIAVQSEYSAKNLIIMRTQK